MFLLIAIPLFILGFLHFFAKDVLWGITVFSLQMQGIEAERTELWYSLVNLRGIVMVLIGIVIIYLGITSGF